MKKFFNQVNIYTLVALLCFIRQDVFGAGNIISQGSFVLYFALSFYYFFVAHSEFGRSKTIKAVDVLLGLFVTYGVLFLITGIDSSWKLAGSPRAYLEGILDSLLPIYAFYYFGRKGLLSNRWFWFWAVLFFATAYIHYQHSLLTALEAAMDNREEVTNNAGYTFLALIPLMALFRKKPVIQYAGLGIISFFVLSGMKRGAILISGICLLVFIWQSLKSTQSSRKTILVLLLSGVLFYVVYHYIENLLLDSSYFNARILSTIEGNSSGRDSIWREYISFYFNQSNPLRMIFGNGAQGNLHYFGISAHNDWLDILVEMGIIGFIVYFLFWRTLYRTYKDAKISCSKEITIAILMFLIIYVMKSLFSQSITVLSIYATSVYGYCIGMYENSKKNTNE